MTVETIAKLLVFLPVCGIAIGFAGMAIDVVFGWGLTRRRWASRVGDVGSRLALASLLTLIVVAMLAFVTMMFLK